MVWLESVNADKNRYRWYSIAVQPTLFGEVDVVTGRGRIGQNGGRTILYREQSVEAAEARVDELLKTRKRNGYQKMELEYGS